MARDLTLTTWEALLSQETQTAFLVLLTISMDQLGDGNWTCLHLTSNNVDVESTVADGVTTETYISFPFDFTLPANNPGQISSVTLSVTNVSQELIDYIRNVPVPMVVNLYVVSSVEPDVVITQHPAYTWRNLSYNASTISGTISLENFLSEPFPGDLMTPYNFPGLFR